MNKPISFMDPEVQTCPFAAYNEVRSAGPVYQDPATGWFYVTEYELVRTLTADSVNLSNDTGFLFNRQTGDRDFIDKIWDQEGGYRPVPALVVVDPPDHSFHRAFINKSFTAARVKQMEQYLDSVVDEVIDEIVYKPDVDFKTEFAIKIPLLVIADQLGMPRSDLDQLHKWSDDILVYLDPSTGFEREVEVTKSICALHRYTAKKVEQYRKNPRECLLSDFANSEVEGRRLTMPEIAAIVAHVLSGGNDSTANAMASGMLRLIEQPQLQSQLRDNPELMTQFVEEVLRLDAPVQGLFRRVLNDINVGGVAIPADSLIILKWGAANRDPAQFPSPDQLDLNRANVRRHLTFGIAPHTCVGNLLARGEMRVGFNKLLKRIRNIRFAPGHAEAMHPPHFFSYGFKELHIAFDRI
jgi:cytochrome P450